VQADFCFNLPFDPQHRLYDPALGGGALLDLGIYPLSFTTMLLGFPERVWGTAQLGETGVDELNALTLGYDRGATAVLTSSMRINRPKEAFVVGSKGYIKVHETFFHPEWLTLAVDGQEPRRVKMPYLGNGYAHEVIETHECLRAGRTESAIMPLDESVRMMGLMDDLRQRWGIQYPGEHAS
jgi:predicted dehydrogenase